MTAIERELADVLSALLERESHGGLSVMIILQMWFLTELPIYVAGLNGRRRSVTEGRVVSESVLYRNTERRAGKYLIQGGLCRSVC